MSNIDAKLETLDNGTSQLKLELGNVEGQDVFIDIPDGKNLVWPVILFLIQVGLYHSRRVIGIPKTIFQLLKRLDLSFLNEVAEEYYLVDISKYKYTLPSWVKFIFCCKLFNQSQEEMLEFLKKRAHKQWLHFIGWTEVPGPQRVSEFKKRFGSERLEWALGQLWSQIYAKIGVNQLSDEQIIAYARKRALFASKSGWGKIGFHLFCQFIDGLGIIAELVSCLKETAPNATFKGRDIILALVHRLVLEATNISQLGGKLANAKGLGELSLAPGRVTLGQAFKDFDANKLKALNERLMKRACHSQKPGQRLYVGIDSTLLEVRGDHENAEYTYDPHTKKYVKAYKLIVACDLDNKDVLYLNLVAGNNNDSKYLLEASAAVKKMVAPKPIDIILFDKGFYNQKNFNELKQTEAKQTEAIISETEESEAIDFVTPGKKYNTLNEAVADINESDYEPINASEILTPHQKQKQARKKAATKEKEAEEKRAENEAKGGPACIAQTEVNLKGYEGSLRLIVVKDKRATRVKLKNDKNNRYIRDEQGNILMETVWETVYHTYLTNISESRLTKEQVIATYKNRWCVEDLFNELKNMWQLRSFPSTSYNTVQAHIYFLVILYQAVSLFKQLVLDKLYSKKMLKSLQVDVFQAPIQSFICGLQPFGNTINLERGDLLMLKWQDHFGMFRVLYKYSSS